MMAQNVVLVSIWHNFVVILNTLECCNLCHIWERWNPDFFEQIDQVK